jgi:NAD(P)-dependent dehydrogenase (short-subunit alcohol dehydrogenase family)
MNHHKKQYDNPFSATFKGINDLFKKRKRIGELSPEERLDGKKVLITGSSSGLGLATAVGLARMGAEVIMAVRSGIPEKGEEVKKRSGSEKVFMHFVDLSDLESIRDLVDELEVNYGMLDIVICNAAIVAKNGIKTKSGLEQMFVVNYLAKFFLIQKLLDKGLIRSSSRLPRIIFVTSESHRNPKEFRWEEFGTFIPHSIGKTVELYGYYKLLLVTYARELSRRLNPNKKPEYSVFTLCPGPVDSNIAREAPALFKPILKLIFKVFFRSPEKASEPILYLSGSTEHEVKKFDYLFLMERKEIADIANDPANGAKLWRLSESLLKKLEKAI